MTPVRFVFCLHNHQPVDNFGFVFEKAYADAYLPMLDALERHPRVRFCAHYSGPLLEWLEEHRPEFLGRLRRLVAEGRLELLGGGFYEPVLSMLPERDLSGQIRMMRKFLKRRLGAEADGAWMTERVWEPHLPAPLSRAGIRYTVLDDFHFRASGLVDEELREPFLTEHEGELVSLFAGSEFLRYAIPFQDPRAALDHLASRAGSVVVFADDGEKFGLWPGTKGHCWEHGWVERFLSALEADERIRTATFTEILRESPPTRRVHLPTCSYREMGEWALPVRGQASYREAVEDFRQRGRFDSWKHWLVGGTWRNFRSKYPEANLMYGRMLAVSRLVADRGGRKPASVRELYRAQCNCPYWHGIFGGLYLPYLRASVYRHLIRAERAVEGRSAGASLVDVDLDGHLEVRLYNPDLNVFVRPTGGGHLLALEHRGVGVNLGATLARRPESYHARLKESVDGTGVARSIHDVVKSKVPGIERHLRYDPYPREGFIDHVLAPGGDPAAIESGEGECGDFAWGEFVHEMRTGAKGSVLSLRRSGSVTLPGQGTRIVEMGKSFVMPPRGGEFVAMYSLSSRDRGPMRFRFAVELQAALCNPDLPGGYLTGEGGGDRRPHREPQHLLGSRLRLHDDWNPVEMEIRAEGATGFWTFPLHTVSQSEDGFELTYQSTVLTPYWDVSLEPGTAWERSLMMRIVTPGR